MSSSAPIDHTHQIAMRIARRCRRVIQACLREEEWEDADREFYLIIYEELQRYAGRELNGRA